MVRIVLVAALLAPLQTFAQEPNTQTTIPVFAYTSEEDVMFKFMPDPFSRAFAGFHKATDGTQVPDNVRFAGPVTDAALQLLPPALREAIRADSTARLQEQWDFELGVALSFEITRTVSLSSDKETRILTRSRATFNERPYYAAALNLQPWRHHFVEEPFESALEGRTFPFDPKDGSTPFTGRFESQGVRDTNSNTFVPVIRMIVETWRPTFIPTVPRRGSAGDARHFAPQPFGRVFQKFQLQPAPQPRSTGREGLPDDITFSASISSDFLATLTSELRDAIARAPDACIEESWHFEVGPLPTASSREKRRAAQFTMTRTVHVKWTSDRVQHLDMLSRSKGTHAMLPLADPPRPWRVRFVEETKPGSYDGQTAHYDAKDTGASFEASWKFKDGQYQVRQARGGRNVGTTLSLTVTDYGDNGAVAPNAKQSPFEGHWYAPDCWLGIRIEGQNGFATLVRDDDKVKLGASVLTIGSTQGLTLIGTGVVCATGQKCRVTGSVTETGKLRLVQRIDERDEEVLFDRIDGDPQAVKTKQLQLMAADPALQTRYQAFLAKGRFLFDHTEWEGINKRCFRDPPKPASYSQLAKVGVLSDIRAFVAAISGQPYRSRSFQHNDRPLQKPAAGRNSEIENTKWFRDLQQLAPVWRDSGLLQP